MTASKMKRGISGDQIIQSTNERSGNLLLGDYLATGESMLLYAPTGQGKTINALMLGIALSTGGSFYDWKATKPVPVLFIEGGELTAYGIAERMRSIYSTQGITTDQNFHLKAPTKQEPFTFNITDPKHQRVLQQYVKDYDIKCVIFDNYNSLRLEEDSEFHSWQRLEHFLNKLKTKGVASVIVHHTNKEGQKQSGAQRKADFCDLVLRIQISRLSTKKNHTEGGKTYIESKMEKFRWGAAAPTTLTQLVFTEGEIDLVPVDYTQVMEETIASDLDEYGIGYVRKKFDFLGYKLDHYINIQIPKPGGLPDEAF